MVYFSKKNSKVLAMRRTREMGKKKDSEVKGTAYQRADDEIGRPAIRPTSSMRLADLPKSSE